MESNSQQSQEDLPDADNAPLSNLDLSDDLNSFDDLGDDAAVRKMSKRIGPMTIVTVLAGIVGIFGLAFFYMQQTERAAEDQALYDQADQESQNAEEFLSRIRTLLPDVTTESIQIQILRKIAQYHEFDEGESVPVITPLLQSNLLTVQMEAARALAAIGAPNANPARPDLMRVLPESQPPARGAIVWALAVLNETNASDAILEEFTQGTLQGQPGFDARVISQALGLQNLSTDELLNHDEISVRTLTAQALAELASPAVVDPLNRLINFELDREEPDENVLREAASGLGRAGDQRAAQALFRLLQRQPNMRAVVTGALRRTVAAPGIANLLQSATDDTVREELVNMLAQSHDPRVADALAGLLTDDDEELQKAAVFGLAEIGDVRAIPPLIALAQSDDLSTGRDALQQLEYMHAEAAAEPLVGMLREDRFQGRRSSILGALGHTGVANTGRTIERYLTVREDDIASDASSAAAALAALDYEPAYARLHRMIPRPRDVDFSTPSRANELAFTTRTAAVRAMGGYGRSEAAEDLMTVVEDPQDDRRLRLDAGYALGAVADDEILRSILAKIQDPEVDEFARRYYVVALWQRPAPALVNDLLTIVENTEANPDLRNAAALAVGYAASPDADARISRLLEDNAGARFAAVSVVLGGTEAQALTLLALLGANSELRDAVRGDVQNTSDNRFNRITNHMFESGELMRRLTVAKILREGEGDNRHGYVWNQVIERLEAGWDGHDGMNPRAIREALWNVLRSDHQAHRTVAASALASMGERGLLMASRDQEGDGSEEARDALRAMNQTN